MSRDHIARDCDEIIIEIVSGDGDVFIDDKIRDYRDKGKLYTTIELSEIHKHLLYIKDQIQFATLFLAALIGFVKLIKPEKTETFQKKISDKFISKNQHFISILWYWIVYYNIWYFIKFVANVLLNLAT